MDAVRLVAHYGHRLLPDYRFDPRSGLWTHAVAPAPAELPELDRPAGYQRAPESVLADQLAQARAILADRCEPDPAGPAVFGDGEWLRWFELPAACLTDQGRVSRNGSRWASVLAW